jgi:hypothetical protein
MDLLAITQTIWRHKLATIPIIVLTLIGAVYVMALKPSVYEASASYILINPPAPPTAEQIAADPALGKIKYDNPYTRFGDQSVVVDVLARTIAAEKSRAALVKAGADPRFVVAPSMEFGFASPIVQITGVGPSAAAALSTARLVSTAVTDELNRMQAVQHVDPHYRIRPLQVDFANQATLRVSGKLRMLVGVMALGALLLFFAVSILKALGERKAEPVSRAQLAALEALAARRAEAPPPEPRALAGRGSAER